MPDDPTMPRQMPPAVERARALVGALIVAFALVPPLAAQGDELKYTPLPYPVVNADTWVLVEIWPTVGDITLSAYFMDFSGRKNQNLCEATKRALDRDGAAFAKLTKRETTSYIQCLTIRDAVNAGYVEARM
jgi:hypothetical protein